MFNPGTPDTERLTADIVRLAGPVQSPSSFSGGLAFRMTAGPISSMMVALLVDMRARTSFKLFWLAVREAELVSPKASDYFSRFLPVYFHNTGEYTPIAGDCPNPFGNKQSVYGTV